MVNSEIKIVSRRCRPSASARAPLSWTPPAAGHMFDYSGGGYKNDREPRAGRSIFLLIGGVY